MLKLIKGSLQNGAQRRKTIRWKSAPQGHVCVGFTFSMPAHIQPGKQKRTVLPRWCAGAQPHTPGPLHAAILLWFCLFCFILKTAEKGEGSSFNAWKMASAVAAVGNWMFTNCTLSPATSLLSTRKRRRVWAFFWDAATARRCSKCHDEEALRSSASSSWVATVVVKPCGETSSVGPSMVFSCGMARKAGKFRPSPHPADVLFLHPLAWLLLRSSHLAQPPLHP